MSEHAAAAGPVFVGRERELAELSLALDEALAGATRVVLVAGEPGIGKTTLADELSARARERGARALWGRAVEGGGAPAFWPWVQVVRSLVGPDAISALAESAVGKLLPEVRGRRSRETDLEATMASEAARFELFDGVARLLAQGARWSPVVVVLDDMHAADLGSLRLLHFCAREIRDTPLLLIGTYRDAEVRAQAELAELVGRISREGLTVALRGLGTTDVASFLRSALGPDQTDSVAASIHELTGGNPLFLQEIVRLLAVEGRLDAPGRTLPEGVRETIRQRLRPLSDDVRAILDVAAVAGIDFSVATVARAHDTDRRRVLHALDEAAALGIVHRNAEAIGRYRFGHALVREALYEELASGDRAELHARIGDAIEQAHGDHLDAHLAEIAHHFYEAAETGRGPKAVEYTRRAGDEALRLLAYEEAASQYERSLSLLDATGETDDSLRCNLLLSLSEAYWKAGEQERARDAFARAASLARRLGEPILLARAALGFGAGGYTGRTDFELVTLLEEALAVLGDTHNGLRARLLARLSLELYYEDVERARGLTAQAVDIARRTDDPATLGYVLNARRNAIWGPDDLEGRLALATEVAHIGQRHGIREFAMEGHVWRLLALAETGDIEAMDRELETITRIAEDLRQPFYFWELDLNRAARAAASGRLAEAERLAARAAERGEGARIADQPLAYGVQLVFIRDLQGRLRELEGALEAFLDAFPQIPALRTGIAYVYGEVGRLDDARAILEAFRAQRFVLPSDRHWLLAVAMLANASRRVGDAAAATELYDLLVPYADRMIATTAVFSFGAASHHLGLLAAVQGRTDVAIEHLEEALRRHIAARYRPWIARTSHALAAVLADRGDPADLTRARTLLRTALETSGELGMAGLVQESRDLYARLGAEPARAGAVEAAADGTVAIMFTDLVSSTELLERVGDDRAHGVLLEHHRLVRAQITEHGGEEARFQGDGFMVVFPDPRAAVGCAVAIQCDVAAYSREHPDTPLDMRAGIHAGVPRIEEGELHGRSVVLASRIAGEAGGGEILVSARVRELVDDKSVLYGPPRTVSLKGLEGAYTLHSVLWG